MDVGHRQPERPVRADDLRAVLEARAIELHRVEQHEDVCLARLVEEAEPREVLGLVDDDGAAHPARARSSAFTLRSAWASVTCACIGKHTWRASSASAFGCSPGPVPRAFLKTGMRWQGG